MAANCNMNNFFIIIPIVTLLGFLIRLEGTMPWREIERSFSFRKEEKEKEKEKEWGDREKKEYRKKWYKRIFIFWLISNIGAFILYSFLRKP